MILSEISTWVANQGEVRRGEQELGRLLDAEDRQHCDAVCRVDQHRHQDQEREHQVVFWEF